MKYIFSFLLVILFLNISCNRNKEVQKESENRDTLNSSTDRIVNSIGETLIPDAKKAMDTWAEYNNVDEFVIKYYNISIMEALINAEELSELVKLMRDTIRIEKLDKLNVIARFNVLHNETLRLADMANIPAIKDEEVKEEVTKILELYSAVNSKINTVYRASALQNSLEVDTEIPVEIKKKTDERPERYINRSTSSRKQ